LEISSRRKIRLVDDVTAASSEPVCSRIDLVDGT